MQAFDPSDQCTWTGSVLYSTHQSVPGIMFNAFHWVLTNNIGYCVSPRTQNIIIGLWKIGSILPAQKCHIFSYFSEAVKFVCGGYCIRL